MNKKKTIALKDPRLRKIRNNLREVISLVSIAEETKIFKLMHQEDKGTTEGYERYRQMHAKMDALSVSKKESTIRCPACSFGADRDVRYNPYDKAWYCVDCFKLIGDMYYIAMAKKETGKYVETDYNEEFARSFTEDDANIEHEIEKIKKAFEKIDVDSVKHKIELFHTRTRREVIVDIINAFFLARIGADEKSFGEISYLLAPFFKKLRETGLYEEYQKKIMLVSIEESGKEFGLLSDCK